MRVRVVSILVHLDKTRLAAGIGSHATRIPRVKTCYCTIM